MAESRPDPSAGESTEQPDERHLVISDPQRIRAMAHPTRLALSDHLRTVEDATATQCAEAVGESVASCSFHLHTLAKYGFIEPAARRGRERPWRWTGGHRTDFRPSDAQAGSRTAIMALADIEVLHQTERIRAYIATVDREDDEWIQATTLTSSTFWVTAAEMAALSAEMHAVAERLFGDRADPASRPDGARHGRLFAVVNPDPLP